MNQQVQLIRTRLVKVEVLGGLGEMESLEGVQREILKVRQLMNQRIQKIPTKLD